MKNFKLKSIVYKNILSVGDTPISIKLDAVLKTLITGTNGAGKSTLLEAITFVLFGRPFRDIKKGQLINSDTKKNMLVEMVMEYDGHTYSIRRGQKPTVFEVLRDGEPVSAAASVRDFQSEFEEMIGMNYNSYKQVVILGTAGYTPFMSLKTPERRKLVEDLLEVSVLAEMDKLNKDEIKLINAELAEINLKTAHNQTQKQTLVEADERQRKLSGDNVARLETMYQERLDALEQLKAANLELNENILAVEIPEDATEESHNAHRAVVQIEGELNSSNRVLTLYQRGGSCPTCLQQLSDASLQSKVEESKAELSKELDRLKEVHAEVHERKVAHLKAKEVVAGFERQIATNRQMAAQHVDQAKRIKSALDEAKSEFVDNSERIASLNEEYNALIETKSAKTMEKHQRSLITEMLKDSGIKGTMIKKYLPLFNKQINHYLSLMEADYSFTLDEEFNETIKSRGREEFSYLSFSQGEKGRIDLAIMFTWRDVAERVSGIKISCLFLDEVFDGAFDAAATKAVTSIINSMGDANVFIISHRDHNPEDYGQHLQMKKVGRFTIME